MMPLGSSIVAAMLAALSPAPAAAAGPFPSEWVGEWELDPDGPDKCALKRTYADGTRIESTGWPGGIHVLDIRNAGWPQPTGGPYKLVSLRGGERLELDRSDSAPNGLRLLSRADLGDRVAASDAIEVIRPDGSVLARIDLAGIAAAAARLPGCLARTAKLPWIVVPPPMAPAAPPLWPELRGLERPPEARFDIRTLLTEADYPPEAFLAREQGTVAYRLSVGTDGRVAGCAITASSGSATLDSATCRLLAHRAVFWPARDGRGRPTAGAALGQMVWQILRKPPPPARPGLERPAQPEVALQTIFTDLDYPSAAVRAGEQGTVVYRLSVGADGRVAGCAITTSSGSEALDSATCRLLIERARFTPARDKAGKPAPDSIEGRIVWTNPEGESLPPS